MLQVWSASFHHSGDFVASGSADTTCKIWDVNTGRCRNTLRLHTAAVNAVSFQVCGEWSVT